MSSFFVQTVLAQASAGTQVTPAPAPPAPPAVNAQDLADQMEQLERLEQLRALENLDIQGIVDQAMRQAAVQDPFWGPHISGELIGLVLGALAMIFLIVVGYPIARSAARRSELKAMNAALPSGEVLARLERIEHAVETMAVEIERISEGQRYTTRLLSEQAGVGGPKP